MIRNHNQNTRFRSITDCFYCIVTEEYENYTLNGKEARAQVLKYYNNDNNKVVKGTKNCDEEQTEQLRSRTALTRKGPSFRLLGNSLMKRI